MWRTSSARRKSLPSPVDWRGPRRMGLRGAAMEPFIKLFGDLLVFVYHCFDRIVGVPVKEVLSQRTTDYQKWVEAFARNHNIPIEWAEKGVRKENYVQPWLRKMVGKNAYGVYFVFKSMEQGSILSGDRAEVPDQGSQSPHLGPPEKPLHP